jgi:hypothetical protein
MVLLNTTIFIKEVIMIRYKETYKIGNKTRVIPLAFHLTSYKIIKPRFNVNNIYINSPYCFGNYYNHIITVAIANGRVPLYNCEGKILFQFELGRIYD